MPSPANLSTPLAFALAYAAMGWHVLPLEPGAKQPLGRLVPRGMHDATTDPEVIRGWWQRSPQAGIGIALAQSGLVAIDVDPRNGGTDTFEQLQAAHGSLRSEVMAFTGGGGEHHVFLVPPGAAISLPGTLGAGIDLKANGYIVVEPSIHPSGNQYGWEASSSPLDGVVPSPLPDWLRNLRVELQQPIVRVGEVPVDPVRARDAREALYLLNADDHDQWVKAGMALHSTRWGHPAYAMWCAWSQQSTKFDSTDQRNRWQSFHADDQRNTPGLTLAWVFAEAQRAGWVNPAARVEGVAPAAVSDLDFAPLNLAEMALRDAVPMRFVVDKWLPVKAVTVLTSHGGVGKSTMSLQLAVCVALGLPWFGKETTQCNVLLISCEDDEQAIHWRLENVCKYMGVQMAALDGVLTVFEMTVRDCVLWARGQATSRMQWLQRMAERYEPGCLILDNASDTFADNENDRTAVRGFVRTLAKIAIEHDSALLLLSHVDKASARGTIESSDSYSGSTAWNNSARSRWSMLRNKDNSIEVANEKNNYAARQDPFKVEYDLAHHVLVSADGGASSIASDLLRNQGRLDIMRAVLKANDSNDRLSNGRNANNNAFRVLMTSYGLSKNITPGDFWNHVDTMESWKYIECVQYQKANRTIGFHMVLTDAGRGKVSNNSGAAPVWSKE